jgi:hypothetical protein
MSKALDRLRDLGHFACARPLPVAASQNIPEAAKRAPLHAYDNRDNALQALTFTTAFPPSDVLREQILSENFVGPPQAKLAWPTFPEQRSRSSAIVGT